MQMKLGKTQLLSNRRRRRGHLSRPREREIPPHPPLRRPRPRFAAQTSGESEERERRENERPGDSLECYGQKIFDLRRAGVRGRRRVRRLQGEERDQPALLPLSRRRQSVDFLLAARPLLVVVSAVAGEDDDDDVRYPTPETPAGEALPRWPERTKNDGVTDDGDDDAEERARALLEGVLLLLLFLGVRLRSTVQISRDRAVNQGGRDGELDVVAVVVVVVDDVPAHRRRPNPNPIAVARETLVEERGAIVCRRTIINRWTLAIISSPLARAPRAKTTCDSIRLLCTPLSSPPSTE